MIDYKINILKPALENLKDIIEYYENEESNLGTKFYKDFENTINTISKNPHYKIVFDDVRSF